MFSNGDRVRISKAADFHPGEIGTVFRVYPRLGIVRVLFDDRSDAAFAVEQVRPTGEVVDWTSPPGWPYGQAERDHGD